MKITMTFLPKFFYAAISILAIFGLAAFGAGGEKKILAAGGGGGLVGFGDESENQTNQGDNSPNQIELVKYSQIHMLPNNLESLSNWANVHEVDVNIKEKGSISADWLSMLMPRVYTGVLLNEGRITII